MGIAGKYETEKARIKQIYHEHKGRYGYRRIMFALRQYGHWLNHKSVQRLMKQLGLKSTVRPKRYRSYRGDVGTSAPHILKRKLEASEPNQKWMTDVTEFNVHGQKVNLSYSINAIYLLTFKEKRYFSRFTKPLQPPEQVLKKTDSTRMVCYCPCSSYMPKSSKLSPFLT
jgi:transposase InsO family protein